MNNKIAVLCLNKEEFNAFLSYIYYDDRPDYSCICREDRLRGMRFSRIVRTDGFYYHKDKERIYHHAQQRLAEDLY